MVNKRKLALLISIATISIGAVSTATVAWLKGVPIVESQIDSGIKTIDSYFDSYVDIETDPTKTQGKGAGTTENPYVISRPVHLHNLMRLVNDGTDAVYNQLQNKVFSFGTIRNGNRCFFKTNASGFSASDYQEYLDMSSYSDSFRPIGNSSRPFNSILNGYNTTINALTISKGGKSANITDYGVLGYTGANARIADLNFTNLQIKVENGTSAAPANVGYLIGQAVDYERAINNVTVGVSQSYVQNTKSAIINTNHYYMKSNYGFVGSIVNKSISTGGGTDTTLELTSSDIKNYSSILNSPLITRDSSGTKTETDLGVDSAIGSDNSIKDGYSLSNIGYKESKEGWVKHGTSSDPSDLEDFDQNAQLITEAQANAQTPASSVGDYYYREEATGQWKYKQILEDGKTIGSVYAFTMMHNGQYCYVDSSDFKLKLTSTAPTSYNVNPNYYFAFEREDGSYVQNISNASLSNIKILSPTYGKYLSYYLSYGSDHSTIFANLEMVFTYASSSRPPITMLTLSGGTSKTISFSSMKVYYTQGVFKWDNIWASLFTFGGAMPVEPVRNAKKTEPSIAATGEKYTLVKSTSSLAVNDIVIIVANSANYAMSTTQNSNNRGQVAITKSNENISWVANLQELTLVAGNKTGTYAFHTGSGYLCAASSSSNYLRTSTSLDDNSSFQLTIESSGSATAIAQGTYTRNSIRYNSGSKIFSCYSSGQAPISFYKKEVAEHTLSISEGTSEIYAGNQSTYSLSCDQGDAIGTVTWSLSSADQAYATVSSGTVKAKNVSSTQTITLNAQSSTHSGKTATKSITIKPNNLNTDIGSITGYLTGSYSHTFVPTWTSTPTGTITYSWSSSPSGAISITNSNSLTPTFTFNKKVNNTKVILTATTAAGISFTKEIPVTVNYKPVESVTISAAGGATTINLGETLQFSANVLPSGSDPSMTWSISSDGTKTTSTGCSINSSGLLTVPANATAGYVTVVGTSTADPTKSDEYQVEVTTAASVTINPKRIGFDSPIYTGGSTTFTASGENIQAYKYNWTTDSPGMLTLTPNGASCNVSLVGATALSHLTVNVYNDVNGNNVYDGGDTIICSDTAEVKVTQSTHQLDLNIYELEITTNGGAQQVTPTVTGTGVYSTLVTVSFNTTYIKIINNSTGTEVTNGSSVSSGTVLNITPLQNQTCTDEIVTFTANGTDTKTLTYSISDIDIIDFTLEHTEITLLSGDTKQSHITAMTPIDASNPIISWSTDDSSIASIDKGTVSYDTAVPGNNYVNITAHNNTNSVLETYIRVFMTSNNHARTETKSIKVIVYPYYQGLSETEGYKPYVDENKIIIDDVYFDDGYNDDWALFNPIDLNPRFIKEKPTWKVVILAYNGTRDFSTVYKKISSASEIVSGERYIISVNYTSYTPYFFSTIAGGGSSQSRTAIALTVSDDAYGIKTIDLNNVSSQSQPQIFEIEAEGNNIRLKTINGSSSDQNKYLSYDKSHDVTGDSIRNNIFMMDKNNSNACSLWNASDGSDGQISLVNAQRDDGRELVCNKNSSGTPYFQTYTDCASKDFIYYLSFYKCVRTIPTNNEYFLSDSLPDITNYPGKNTSNITPNKNFDIIGSTNGPILNAMPGDESINLQANSISYSAHPSGAFSPITNLKNTIIVYIPKQGVSLDLGTISITYDNSSTYAAPHFVQRDGTVSSLSNYGSRSSEGILDLSLNRKNIATFAYASVNSSFNINTTQSSIAYYILAITAPVSKGVRIKNISYSFQRLSTNTETHQFNYDDLIENNVTYRKTQKMSFRFASTNQINEIDLNAIYNSSNVIYSFEITTFSNVTFDILNYDPTNSYVRINSTRLNRACMSYSVSATS